MREEKSSGAIVFFSSEQGTEFLLLHYGKGHWGFPKGHLEESETEEQALLRELAEETAIADAEIVPGFREEINYFFKEKGETVSKTVSFYLLESKTKEVKLSFEHSEFEWLPFGKALEGLSFRNTKELLKKADAFLAKRFNNF